MRVKLLLPKRARRAMPEQPRRAVFSFSSFISSTLGKAVASGTALAVTVAGVITFSALQPSASQAASAVATPDSLEAIAEAREAALSQESDEIAQNGTETALANRQQQLANENQAILNEAERREKLSEFMWPTEGTVNLSNDYGPRYHPILHHSRMHDGIDIGASCSQPIYAAQSGTVTQLTTGYSGGSGISVRIDHGEYDDVNIATRYLHMSKYIVKMDQKVEKGQLIGYVGSTGLSTGCHLHLSLYKNGKSSDPAEYVQQSTTK